MKTLAFKLFVLSSLVLALTNCQKTTVVPGSDLSGDIQKIVPQSVIDDLRKRGMTVNEGQTPPTLNGTIYVDPYRLVSPYGPDDAWSIGKIITSYYYKFYGQTADNKIKYDFTNGSDKGTGNGAFVSGKDNLFTIFSQDNGTLKGVNYKSVAILSGELTDKGIKNCQYAFVITEKSADPDGIMIDVGQGRIWEDGDKLATFSTTFPQARLASAELTINNQAQAGR
jgi:hypothetical protein